jgi:Tfp pilus assembly pilus retraction ATPase PilT
MQSGGVEGMQTLDQDLQRLVTQGKIDRSMAAQIANNPKLFGADVL